VARRCRDGPPEHVRDLMRLRGPRPRAHAETIERTAFADRSPEQGRRFASHSGVDAVGIETDHRALLDHADVDAVLVPVPIPSLYDVARDALTAVIWRCHTHPVGSRPARTQRARGPISPRPTPCSSFAPVRHVTALARPSRKINGEELQDRPTACYCR
jgi:GFO/IDH/MocA oxidoreductase family protein